MILLNICLTRDIWWDLSYFVPISTNIQPEKFDESCHTYHQKGGKTPLILKMIPNLYHNETQSKYICTFAASAWHERGLLQLNRNMGFNSGISFLIQLLMMMTLIAFDMKRKRKCNKLWHAPMIKSEIFFFFSFWFLNFSFSIYT